MKSKIISKKNNRFWGDAKPLFIEGKRFGFHLSNNSFGITRTGLDMNGGRYTWHPLYIRYRGPSKRIRFSKHFQVENINGASEFHRFWDPYDKSKL